MAQGCYSPPGCHPGVGEAAVVAHVYVREKRNVVVEIWGQVAQKVPNLNLEKDLNHPDWADPLPPPAVDITDAGPEGREDQIEKEGEASPSVPSGSAPSARSWSVVEDLPLRVVAAVNRTGNAGQSRIHLLNVEGTAVGCGWRPAASKVHELSVLDYMTEQEAYGKCERCFKRHGFPADWALEPAEVPTLQEDSGSETDDSVDTQSETEVVALYTGSLGAPGPGNQGDGGPREGPLPGPSARHPSKMAGVPDCPSEMALSVCTPVLQFLRIVSWVAHEAHPALVI